MSQAIGLRRDAWRGSEVHKRLWNRPAWMRWHPTGPEDMMALVVRLCWNRSWCRGACWANVYVVLLGVSCWYDRRFGVVEIQVATWIGGPDDFRTAPRWVFVWYGGIIKGLCDGTA